MKKTWTTKVLIALMTLALVVGVFGIAPREAQAAAPIVTATGTLTQTIYVTGNISDIMLEAQEQAVDDTYVWTLADIGQLPAWMAATGLTGRQLRISGANATEGSWSFRYYVEVKDNTGTSRGIAYSQTITITVNKQPSIATVVAPQTPPSGAKVGADLPSCVFTIGGEPMPDSVTVSGLGNDLSYNYNKGAKTVTITGKPAAVGSRTITVSATNATGTGSASTTFAVDKGDIAAPGISGPTSVSKGESITLTATGIPSGAGGTYEWMKGSQVISGATGSSYTYSPGSDSSPQTFTVKWNGNTDYNATAASTGYQVTIDEANPNLSISPSSKTVNYGSSAFALSAQSLNQTTTPTWSLSGPGTLSGSGWSVMYTPPTAATPSTSTATITVEQAAGAHAGTNYRLATATANITITPTLDVIPSSITNSSTPMSIKVGGANGSFTVEAAAGATVTASANNNKVTVTKTSTGTNAHFFEVKPVSAGDAQITVTSNGMQKTIFVHIAGQYPVIEVQFWAGDKWCPTTTLSKATVGWGTLKVTVKDYNPAYPYVTLTRSNIRTYIGSGYNSYHTHPSTYTYTAYLTQVGTEGQATLAVYAQYNGSTYYTASYTGAVASVNSPTIYVTGYTTLPQTGPNYTWAYVLGGLCLASVATAVTLNVRKKKRENV